MTNRESRKIQNFTDLIVWQKAHELVLAVYKLTKNFPKEELFGLTSQMRRAVVSITSNIAEGFSRQYYKEKIQFYLVAQASNTELQNQLIISRDISYLKLQDFSKIINQSKEVEIILNGLIKKSRQYS